MNLLSALVSGTGKRGKLLLGILIILPMIAGFAYAFGGLIFCLFVLLPLFTVVFTVSKNVWSSDSGQTAVAVVSVGAVITLVALAGTGNAASELLLKPVYEQFPTLSKLPIGGPVSAPLLVLGAIAILVINYWMRDGSAMNKHATPLEKEFPEPQYKERLKSFCRILKDSLDRVENEANWSVELFVPLDAEVQTQLAGGPLNRKTDFLSAIRKEKTAKNFLVIGQPGSGKSVALRKLCRDLLTEVEATGKVPVYVNLKEWVMETLDADNPPSVERFHAFIVKSLKNQGDVFIAEFLDVYFNRMVEAGRVFFILDSFDEIPALLQEDNSGWILDEVSRVIHQFLNGAHDSRGILATRPYKRPSNKFVADSNIHILPFSEERIERAMAKYPSITEQSRRELLVTRRDLLPIAKNPFYCALIINYLKANSNNLPESRAELFGSYIDKRIADSDRRIADLDLSASDIRLVAERIAGLMFRSETFGFEIPISELYENIDDLPADKLKDAVGILVYSKIGRHSNSEKTFFTFAHKRFAEYFAVLSLIGKETDNLQSDIHSDGKWRDVLVLLSELESDERSAKIASFAWAKLVEAHNELAKTGKTFSLTAIHGLRFLRDAYLSRKSCISGIQANLGTYIWIQLTQGETILQKKIALECVGLLDESVITPTISEAFRQNISWLSETALKSCFYLNTIEESLYKKLVTYVDALPLSGFVMSFRNLLFVLKLSDNFRSLVMFAYVRLFDALLIIILYAAYVVYNPYVALVYVMALVLKFDQPWARSENFSPQAAVLQRLGAVITPLTALGLTNISNLILSPTGFQITRWDTPWWLVAFNFFLILPLYQFYYYVVRFKARQEVLFGWTEFGATQISDEDLARKIDTYNQELTRRELHKPRSGLIKQLLLWTSAVLFLGIVISFLPTWIAPYGYVVLGLGLSTVYFGGIVENIQQFRDNRLIGAFFRANAPRTRDSISRVFFQMKTASGRLNFVSRLGTSGLSPTGDWPNSLPNIRNDEASARLAQLEEGWRNLDR